MGKLQTGLTPAAYCPLKLGGYTHLGKPLLSSPLIILSTHHTQYHNNTRITCYTINSRHKFASFSVYTPQPSSIQFITIYLTIIFTHITWVLSPSKCSLSISTIVHVLLFSTHLLLLSLSLFIVHSSPVPVTHSPPQQTLFNITLYPLCLCFSGAGGCHSSLHLIQGSRA